VPRHGPLGLPTITRLQGRHDGEVFFRLFPQTQIQRGAHPPPGGITHRPKQQFEPIQLGDQQRIAASGRDGIVQLVVETAGQIDDSPRTEVAGGQQPAKLPGQLFEQIRRQLTARLADRLALEHPPDMDQIEQIARSQATDHGPTIGPQLDHANSRQRR
jgi:hypothetical protein